jgi:hypothetical protein
MHDDILLSILSLHLYHLHTTPVTTLHGLQVLLLVKKARSVAQTAFR